jgi:uncharacterized protein (TIGR02246 family)
MTSDSTDAARELLAELEERLATHDIDQMVDLFTDDVVLIGDSVENFDRDSTVEYLKSMADMAPTVRWEWDTVAELLHSSEALCFAAAGTMTFYNESQQPLGEGGPFRVTCLAMATPAGWRLRHFHGSAPQAD